MKRVIASVVPVWGIVCSLALTGCPSKDNTSSSGATSPPSGSMGPGTGPLANLESAPFANEVWIAQEGGAQMPFIFYTQQNVRMSAPCRNGAGQLDCEAIRFLRGGKPVDVPRRMLTGSVSAGTRACTKMGNQLVTGRSPNGAEDGFCRFPDGSLLSTGALEQYGVRITE
jgi:putative hemolysin